MDIIEVNGKLRDVSKKSVMDLRKNGNLPAVIYGLKKLPAHISLPFDVINKIYLKHSTFFSLILNINFGDKKELVFIKNYDLHPVSNSLVHLDLQRLPKFSKKVKIKVALFFINSAICPAVKSGSMLFIKKRWIFVNCDSDKIVNEIEIDLHDSQKGQSLCIGDFSIPESMRHLKYRDNLVAKFLG